MCCVNLPPSSEAGVVLSCSGCLFTSNRHVAGWISATEEDIKKEGKEVCTEMIHNTLHLRYTKYKNQTLSLDYDELETRFESSMRQILEHVGTPFTHEVYQEALKIRSARRADIPTVNHNAPPIEHFQRILDTVQACRSARCIALGRDCDYEALEAMIKKMNEK